MPFSIHPAAAAGEAALATTSAATRRYRREWDSFVMIELPDLQLSLAQVSFAALGLINKFTVRRDLAASFRAFPVPQYSLHQRQCRHRCGVRP